VVVIQVNELIGVLGQLWRCTPRPGLALDGRGKWLACVCALSVAAVAAGQSVERIESRLRAESLYNGIDRPMMIRIADRGEIGPLKLVVLNDRNEALMGPIEVRAGRADLSELMPGVWELRETAYLQLLEYDTPTGTALVLQPMLTRMVPVTRQSTRPNGAMYTKIVGWRSEMEPAPAPAPEAEEDDEENVASDDDSANDTAEDGKRQSDGGARDESSSSNGDVAAPSDATPMRLCSGIRAYPERDVEVVTELGRILLAMRPDEAPNTVWNFLRLCEGGFYREVAFHRIVPSDRMGRPFVIQAGDPTETGEGGPGFWLPMEPSELKHEFGVISMARADDPDSAGSQFFICLSREGTARLDGQYCAFGQAMDGAETIRAIAEVELADVAAGRPVDPPVIVEARLVPAPARAPGEVRVPVWEQVSAADEHGKEKQPTRVPR